MPRYLLIVAQGWPDLCDYWKRWFAGVKDVQVTLDRRLGERRQQAQPYEPERRRADRRYRRGVGDELQSRRFAIIRRHRRALVVEDNEIVRDAVAMMLHLDDFEVDTVIQRAEALSLIGHTTYDVIVSDLGLPGVETFYRELKQRRPDALPRLIFMTGHTDTPEYATFLNETGAPVLAKPFTLEDLRRAVRRVVGTT